MNQIQDTTTTTNFSEDLIITIQAKRLKELLKWRQYLPSLTKAVKEVLGEAEVYIFGSAVEGRLTVDSDIDILIVVDQVPKSGLKRAKTLDKIWKIMEEKGTPWWYPFEIHLITRKEIALLEKPTLIKIS
ncbi:MAG: nucleotidyltransferase domain-containing protein [Nitrososphaeria archaeon]|nr:nucleotidyltransferase domain-containing protein [Nitrososphaeria archaeon]